MSSGGVILPASGDGVTSINGDTGAVTIAAGSGIQVDTVGNTITVSNTEAGGSVTAVSVVTANGLAGSVADPSTTPAITLSTTITGILQGNGTAISAATLGNLTDVGTDGIVITGGTGAVLGTGTSIAQTKADATHNGYLSSADWATFNGKGAGSVTSVALVMPAEYAVSGSPVTTTGSLTAARPPLTATAKVANYTLLNTDYAIKVDNTSGAFAITMPSPSANASHIYIITNIGTGTNLVTISPNGSETFGASALAALHLTTIGESWTLMSDGTNWVILAHYASTSPATYTISISVASGTTPTKGTVVVDRAVWWRQGKYMKVRWSYQQSAAGTSAGNTAVIQYNLPAGYLADTSAQPASTTQFQSIDGSAFAFFPSSITGPLGTSLYDSSHFCFWSGNTINTPNNFNWSAVGTSVLGMEIAVPIANWEA